VIDRRRLRTDHVLAPLDDVLRIDERRVLPAAADHPVRRPCLCRAARRSRTLTRVDPIVAAATLEHVTATAAHKEIPAALAEQLVPRAVPDQQIVATAAAHVLHIAVHVVALAADAVVRALADRHPHRPAALAVEDDVAARAAGKIVRAEAAAKAVVVCAATQSVSARAAIRLVVARVPVQPVGARLALQ
jgi:hypothetical protein